MEERDFTWCYNHENLFREWLTVIYFYANLDNYDLRLDKDIIFDCWKMAKQYAYKIANSEQPRFLFVIMMYDLSTKKPDNYPLIFQFLNSILASSKNKNLETFANFGNEHFEAYLSEKKIDPNTIEDFLSNEDPNIFHGFYYHSLLTGQIESDYDYSLPDGGIKDETETITKTDETETKTITETDETITKTKTKTETEEESVDVILPKYNALNNKTSISAMRKAIEIGWIEIIEKGKYKWVGPTLIGTKKIKGYSNAALAYFIAKALKIKMELNQKKSLTETSKDSIKNNFPPINDIKEVFGEEIKRQQLEDALERKNVQVWRIPIDEFFEDIYNFIGN